MFKMVLHSSIVESHNYFSSSATYGYRQGFSQAHGRVSIRHLG